MCKNDTRVSFVLQFINLKMYFGYFLTHPPIINRFTHYSTIFVNKSSHWCDIYNCFSLSNVSTSGLIF
jgi:hypothetical protein